MLDRTKVYTANDLTLIDDGTLDTVVELPDGTEWRYSDTSDYRDIGGMLDFDRWAKEVVLPDMDSDAEWA